jgi:hypothetical protein
VADGQVGRDVTCTDEPVEEAESRDGAGLAADVAERVIGVAIEGVIEGAIEGVIGRIQAAESDQDHVLYGLRGATGKPQDGQEPCEYSGEKRASPCRRLWRRTKPQNLEDYHGREVCPRSNYLEDNPKCPISGTSVPEIKTLQRTSQER